ncbi:MAG TPA: hypothetical protein VHC22_16140 [Pirellulales bacterium]|nr:hypothetical protein [Pirellulales bacterium]
MDENPYRSPKQGAAKEPSTFLRWPATILEWAIVVAVVIVALLLFLPDLDEGRQASRQRLGTEVEIEPGNLRAADRARKSERLGRKNRP